MFTHRNIKQLQASLLIRRICIYSLILKYRECLEQILSEDKTGGLIQELDGEGKPAAAYIYLNNLTLAGPIARIEMNKDLLPPATTITLGEPQYKNTSM